MCPSHLCRYHQHIRRKNAQNEDLIIPVKLSINNWRAPFPLLYIFLCCVFKSTSSHFVFYYGLSGQCKSQLHRGCTLIDPFLDRYNQSSFKVCYFRDGPKKQPCGKRAYTCLYGQMKPITLNPHTK